MVSSKIYTNHSSSFFTAKIIWINSIPIRLDVPSMAGSSRTGLLITMILAHSGQVLERPLTSLSQSNDRFKLSLIQMLMHSMRLRWRSSMVRIWYFDNKSLLSINTFCHISQMDNCRAWMMFVFFFLPEDVFELLGTFSQNYIWLWYFSLFSNFWLPLHSRSVLHGYCSIKQLFCSI